jgi:glutathione peroxidase
MSDTVYDIPVKTIDGKDTNLGAYKGKVVLVVNVASACGLTPQYEGLEKLYEAKKDKGLVVAGFPANEFGAQEPGTNEEIAQFCTSKFGVKFPMFEKIVVKGPGQHPLYKKLVEAQPRATEKADSGFKARLAAHGRTQEKPSDVLWNFEKFLIGKNGAVVGRFAPDIPPEDPLITSAIEKELMA